MADLSGAVANQSSQQARERIVRRQRQSFRELLAFAWKHSSFYRDFYQSHGIREEDLPELSVTDLPFLTKQILMDHFDVAVTDPRLHRTELDEWIDKDRDPRQRFHEDFIVIHSSGSSGNMGIFVYDRTAWQVMSGTMATRLPLPVTTPSRKTKAAFYIASHGHFAGVTSAVQMPASAYSARLATRYSSSVTYLADIALDDKLHICPQTICVSGDLINCYKMYLIIARKA
jgi:phenylacetate-coenzyme A ligase PaaK-like adenylate-forming protein